MKKTETGKQNMFSVTSFFICNLFYRFIELFQKGRTTLLHSSKVNFENRDQKKQEELDIFIVPKTFSLTLFGMGFEGKKNIHLQRHLRTTFKSINKLLKVAFIQKVRFLFQISNSPKKKFRKTILSLKFEFVVYCIWREI